MRRIAALLLILTSGWLLYQTSREFPHFSGRMSPELMRAMMQVNILAPLAAGLLGLFGGLLVFLGGGGGAGIALIGALIAVAFSATAGAGFIGPIWEDELVVGATMLVLALAAALMKRR